MKTINKISWAEQALEQIDEDSVIQAELEFCESGGVAVDGDGEQTDEFKIWYYNQCN